MVMLSFFGPHERIRTPDLQNRNLLHYPTVLHTENLFNINESDKSEFVKLFI